MLRGINHFNIYRMIFLIFQRVLWLGCTRFLISYRDLQRFLTNDLPLGMLIVLDDRVYIWRMDAHLAYLVRMIPLVVVLVMWVVDGFIINLITMRWRLPCVFTSSDLGGSFMIRCPVINCPGLTSFIPTNPI